MTAPPELEAALWAARMLWAVGTGACLLASDLPCISVGPLRRIAHYGKLRADAPAGGGPLPQLQARLAALALPARGVWAGYYAGGAVLNAICLWWEPCALLALLQLHLLRRLYETVRITRFSGGRREHPLTVCVGTFFYVLLSPSLALEVRIARRQGAGAGGSSGGALPAAVFAAAFALANVAQHSAHVELARMRASGRQNSVTLKVAEGGGHMGQAVGDVYRVPSGWLFRRVSCCPHYSCEVLLYVSLALFAAADPRGGEMWRWLAIGPVEVRVCICAWMAALFALVNLSITAVRTRKWYGKQPASSHLATSAIIPGVL